MKTKSVKVLLSAMAVLLSLWALESCSKKDNPAPALVTTSLSAEIAVATNLLSTTSEGTGTGDYLKGSQAILQGVVTQAQATLTAATAAGTTTTQATIDAATAQLTAAVTAYQAAIIVPVDAADLVGQWTFDELTTVAVGTSVKDYSGLGNNGSIKAGAPYFSTTAGLPYSGYVVSSNVPTQVADRYGIANKALHFEAGANVDIPYSTSLNPGSITIALWAKADSLPNYWANNYMVSMNRWNCYKFQIQNTPRAFFTAYLANGTDSTDQDLDQNVGAIKPLTAWYHLAVTLGGGNETFYINGIQVYQWTTAMKSDLAGAIVNLNNKTSVKFSPVDLVIGQDLATAQYTNDSNSPFYVNYGGYFIGALDEVRIYKTALSAAQITAIYNQEKP
jgi:hypothetical protein